MTYLFSAKPQPNKKGGKKAPIEQTASKSVTPSIKGYENHSPCFDVDK